VIPVPTGHFLLVTDITISPNSLATTGRAIVFIGRDDGAGIPSQPLFDLWLDVVTRSYRYQWSIPQLILKEGERIGIYSSTSSDRVVDVTLSGYLLEAEGFGR
jgi:hypothetical protein